MATNGQLPPMESLPPELSEMICSHLGCQSIHSLLQVSRRQKRIAEPYLYKHVSFESLDAKHVQLLLLRIIDRPDFAERIKSISLFTSAAEDYTEPDASEACQASVASLNSAIDSVMSKQASRRKRANKCVSWLVSALNGNNYPPRCLEATLALIVGIAPKLEKLILDFSCRCDLGPYFFSLLAAMKPELLSKVRYLNISIWNLDRDAHRILGLENFVHLHTLILSRTSMQLNFLDKICFNGSTPNLLHLRLDDIDTYRTPVVQFENFSTTISRNCPKLKSLYLNLNYAKQLSGLHQLINLESLVLCQPELLVDKDEWTSFSDTRDRLPPNLTSLKLLNISDWMVIELIKTYGIHKRDRETRNARRKEAVSYLTGILLSTSIKSLELHAREFKRIVPILQPLVDEIYESSGGDVRLLTRDDCGVCIGYEGPL